LLSGFNEHLWAQGLPYPTRSIKYLHSYVYYSTIHNSQNTESVGIHRGMNKENVMLTIFSAGSSYLREGGLQFEASLGKKVFGTHVNK
jgi:hypothetical protein